MVEDYDSMLNQTDIKTNKVLKSTRSLIVGFCTEILNFYSQNKFYVIQLLSNGPSFHVWTRWGRVGEEPGQTSMLGPFSSKEEGEKAFEAKFKVSYTHLISRCNKAKSIIIPF